MTIRTGGDALNWAANQVNHPSKNWHNLCLQFVRMCFGVGAVYPSAEKAWYATKYRHGTKGTPPAGVPVYWTNGRNGHIAISAGNGYVYSNDFKRDGKIDKVSIASITRGWGQTYRGWTEDVNGVRVYGLPAKGSTAKPPAPVPVKNMLHMRRINNCAKGFHLPTTDPAYKEVQNLLNWAERITRSGGSVGLLNATDGTEVWERAIRQKQYAAAGTYLTRVIRNIQRRYGLPQTGVFDSKTAAVPAHDGFVILP